MGDYYRLVIIKNKKTKKLMCLEKAKTSRAHWKLRRPKKETMEEPVLLRSTIFKYLNSLNWIQHLSAGSETDSEESNAEENDDDQVDA